MTPPYSQDERYPSSTSGLGEILLSILILISIPIPGIPQASPPPSSTFPTLSMAPTGLDRFDIDELLGTTSQKICARQTVDVARTSSTVLTVASLASATNIEYVRSPNDGESVITSATTTITLSGTTSADVGMVWIYATRVPVTGTSNFTLTIYARHNLPTATVACAGSPGCTVERGAGFPSTPGVIPINSWLLSSTPGQFDVSGGTDGSPNATCWIDYLFFSNSTAAAVTVTVTNGGALTSQTTIVPTLSIPANGTVSYVWPGGKRFQAGATWVAGDVSAIYGEARFARQGK